MGRTRWLISHLHNPYSSNHLIRSVYFKGPTLASISCVTALVPKLRASGTSREAGNLT